MAAPRRARHAPAGRPLARRLHRWLGVFLGSWFALVGLSGSVLVFEDEVDAYLNPQLLTDARTGPRLAAWRVLERMEEEMPLARVERIRPPAREGDVYRITYRVAPHLRSGSPRAEATMSPVTGEILGQRDADTVGISRPYWMRTLYEFHRNLLLGPAGANLVGTAGLLLLASGITGILVAWPRTRGGWRRLVGIKTRGGATRALFDLHRSSGVFLVSLLLLATATGSTLVWVNYARDLVGLFSPVAPFPVIPWRTTPAGDWASFEDVLHGVEDRYPFHAISEIHLPSKPTAGYLFYLRRPGDVHRLGDTLVWAHSATGEILFVRGSEERSAGETLMHWLFPLHSGTAFGLAGRIAMGVTGAAVAAMFATGLWIWMRKRRAERFEEARRERSWPEAAPVDTEPRVAGA